MKTSIGLNGEARPEVGQMINLLLADESGLHATARDCHSKAIGPEFPSPHRQLAVESAQVAGWIRTDGEACATRLKAAGPADFLAGLMQQHKKAAWTLRAQLETQEEESA